MGHGVDDRPSVKENGCAEVGKPVHLGGPVGVAHVAQKYRNVVIGFRLGRRAREPNKTTRSTRSP
jgi:UDP-3-O-[3-hydroxymyristoyl] glucosamine N-acyltransferase